MSSISITLSIGIILIAGWPWSLFQTNTNLFNNNFYFSLNNIIQFVYAQDENDDDDDDNGKMMAIDDKGSSEKENNNVAKDDNKNSNHQHKEDIIFIEDALTCRTQSAEVIQLNGTIIKPKGIILLADFNPCQLSNGKLTFHIPLTPFLKLGIMYIDYSSNGKSNPAGAIVSPTQVQSIDSNRGILTVQLDEKMKGKEPATKEDTTLTNINGLGLYNSGDTPLEFKDGDVAILRATFLK